MKIRYCLTAVISLAVFAVLFGMASPMLRYAEGWNTFYYDSHYISSEFALGNTSSLVEGFFLQFFHTPWHGVVLMSLLLLFVEAVLMLIMKRVKNNIVNCVVPFVLTLVIAISSVSNLSRTGIMAILGFGNAETKTTIFYKQLCNMERDMDWDGILEKSTPQMPVNNLLLQNMINMAMAEKGMLHEHLYDNPCVDINSIYVSHIESEYIAAMMSDIYYSMGHMAQAQRYAFEANEKMDNHSPRLLQRLIKTNIIYGQYAVARKYLKKLSAAVYYKDWCEHYTALLNDAAVLKDKELSEKRLCLNIANKFSGFNGLDKDLLMVARATKGHKQSNTTVQYLSALYRLAGYKAEYESLTNEFHLKAQ